MRVIVVTNLELGWDNVVAVFDASVVTGEELQKAFPDNTYVFTDLDLEFDLSNYTEQ